MSLVWLQVEGIAVFLPGVLALGVVVGYLAGMFGVGGGFLLTPLLSVVFGLPIDLAVGTGLSQMVGTSLASYLKHRALEQGEQKIAILLAAGTLLGVEAGALALTALGRLGSVRLLGGEILWIDLVAKSTFAGLLAATAWLSWRRRSLVEPTQALPGPLARLRIGPTLFLPRAGLEVSAVVVAYLGLSQGFLSGFFGIGGGIVLLPLLVYGFGLPLRHAAATGLGLMCLTASVGAFSHAMRGNVSLPLAMALLVGSTVAAQFGALASKRLAAGRQHRIFALLTLGVAASLVWDVARRL